MTDTDTPQRPFTRTQILERLRAQLAQGKPIVGAGSSSGLIAKSAAAGGADLIIVYNPGRTRLMGLATSHLLNHANPTTLSMYREIANVVRDTPIIAVTSYAMVGDREKSLAAGCTGYIEKPINPETFVTEITRFGLPPRPVTGGAP